MKKLLKNWKFWVIAVLVVVLLFTIFGGKKDDSTSTYVVSAGSIKQIVSASGRIQSSQSVDLGFEIGGKISYVGVKVGDKVSAGKTLMSLHSSDYSAQIQREKANLATAETKLNQILNGTRDEELKLAQVAIDNAKTVLSEEKEKNSIYVAQKTLGEAINSLVTISDIQSSYFLQNNQDGINLSMKKDIALNSIYGEGGLGNVQSWYFLGLNSGLKKKIDDWAINPSNENPKLILPEIKSALSNTLSVIDTIKSSYTYSLNLPDSEKTTINTLQTTLLSQVTSINAQIQAITNAENAVATAEAQYNLKSASATNFDVDIARQQVAQAKASLAYAQAQLSKRIIAAPFSGTITAVNGKIGELIGSNPVAISMINDAQYEIEVNIAESDIAKVRVGNKVEITIDAYEPSEKWEAIVSKIYPSAAQIEGVATYKTIMQFLKIDDRIKSGMTANVEIVTDQKDNVLAIPQRAVIKKGDEKFAKVLVSKNSDGPVFEERKIETGLKGSDGNIEIISGLKGGDEVLN